MSLKLKYYFVYSFFSISMLLASTSYSIQLDTSFSSKKSAAQPEFTYETEFTCSDTIYILMRTKDIPIGLHDIELRWINPLGKRQELTQFETYASSNEMLIWAWLRLKPPSGSQVLRAFDQSFGMREFIGKWKVKILIDGKQLETKEFEILC